MYFRKSKVANDVLYNTRGGFCQAAMSKDFLVKGVGIENESCQESPYGSARNKLEKGISAKPRNKSFNEIATSSAAPSSLCVQVQNIYKAENQKEDNNTIEKSIYGKDNKTQMNANSHMSALTTLKKHRSRESLQRPQLNVGSVLRNRTEPKFYSLYDKYENEAHNTHESNLGTKHSEALQIRTRRQVTFNLSFQTSAASEMALTSGKQDETESEATRPSQGDEACKNLQRLDRTSSAKVRGTKCVNTYGKSCICEDGRKLKALNCALSRGRSHSMDQTLEDEDYQEVDIEYLLKLKTASRLSRMCDASVIEAVAMENSVKTENFLPPVHGSKWTLTDRYTAQLSFNPSTPVLREYTRISQARVVDFSDAGIGSQQVYIM